MGPAGGGEDEGPNAWRGYASERTFGANAGHGEERSGQYGPERGGYTSDRTHSSEKVHSPRGGSLARRSLTGMADPGASNNFRRGQGVFSRSPSASFLPLTSESSGIPPAFSSPAVLPASGKQQGPTSNGYSYPNHGRTQSAVPSSMPISYLKPFEDSEAGTAARNLNSRWRELLIKIRRGRRKSIFGKGSRKHMEKTAMVIIFLAVCSVVVLSSKLGGTFMAHDETHPLTHTTIKNLTHLNTEELLAMDESERTNAFLLPPVIAGVKLGEWEKKRLEVVEPRVSLIAACKDRTAMLVESLPSWQKALDDTDEIIVVDWSTSTDMLSIEQLVQKMDDDRISTIRVLNEDSWILSHAYNLAAQFATGELLLKIDCDTKMDPEFLAKHPIGKDDNQFYRVAWRKTKTENEQHLSGTFFLPARYFHEVRGYDERIQSYGWDDSDLYKRIEELDVTPRDVDITYLEHIEHEDDSRAGGRDDFESPMFHTQLNSILMEQMQSWSIEWTKGHTEFACVTKTGDGRFVEAVMTTKALRLEDAVPQGMLSAAEKTARNRVLHDAYGLPWGVINELEGSVPDVLDAFQNMSEHSRKKKPGAIFGEVVGGPAQRLLALMSLVALAMKHDRMLFLSWGSVGKNTKFSAEDDTTSQLSALFDWGNSNLIDDAEAGADLSSRIFTISRLKCGESVEACAQSDPAWTYVVSGHNETEVAMALRRMKTTKTHILLHLDHTLKGLTNKDLLGAFRRLVPSNMLEERIKKFGDTSKKLGVYVGAHMRSKQIMEFAKTLRRQANNTSDLLVVGSEEADAVGLRRELEISSWEDDISYETETNYERMVRELSELYALSRAKKIFKDGRCPDEVKELIEILNSDKPKEVVISGKYKAMHPTS